MRGFRFPGNYNSKLGKNCCACKVKFQMGGAGIYLHLPMGTWQKMLSNEDGTCSKKRYMRIFASLMVIFSIRNPKTVHAENHNLKTRHAEHGHKKQYMRKHDPKKQYMRKNDLQKIAHPHTFHTFQKKFPQKRNDGAPL